MTAERRAEIFEVLAQVIDTPPGERPKRLDELCGDDGALRREVEARLAHADAADGFLSAPVLKSPARAPDLAAPDLAAPDLAAPDLAADGRVGPYRVVGVLGRGGMGTVYRAVREDDFAKQVAIKLIPGDASDAAVSRFHDERQILARLEHPSIARLLDGGTTGDGRPFLVMECVDGVEVDRYCDERQLGVRARLELFCRVADAVAYAHRNLVVHRDLKPGNILVNAAGDPKLLDFGIAKLLQADPARDLTVDAAPMTPRYASPEQILGQPMTTASDVYGLGLVLYQLLTGRLPNGLDTCTLAEIPRRICDEEPLRPSTAVPKEQAALRRSLAGDVDAVVLKALRKEPQHRYGSAEAMADDVRRHLEGRPVRARRSTWTYRTGKFVRRYRWGVAAALLVTLLSITSTVLWRRAVVEGRRAELGEEAALHERTRAETVSDFLLELFKSAKPDTAHGGSLTVREVADQGRARILATDEDEDPEINAELAGTLGDVYLELGLYDEALELLEHSARIRRRLHPEGHPDLAAVLNNLASVHYYVGRYVEAERRFREVLALRHRLGQEPSSIALALSNVASAIKQQGRYAEAGALYREVLTIRMQLYGPDDAHVGSTLYSLGTVYYEEGDLERAEVALRRALEIRSAAYGERHTRVATVQNSLGRVLAANGKLQEAEELLRAALRTRRELLGNDHDHTALTARDLAELLRQRGTAERRTAHQADDVTFSR